MNSSSITLSEWETDDLQYKNKVGTLYVARKLILQRRRDGQREGVQMFSNVGSQKSKVSTNLEAIADKD